MNDTTDWLQFDAAVPDESYRIKARKHQDNLTKPPGALGQLEQAAITLATLQATDKPSAEQVSIVIFAGDHGVTAEGISAFPQAVTAEMLKNFSRGGAAINVLARTLNARLEVINLGTAFDPGNLDNVSFMVLGPGTANFCEQPAMTESQLARAINAGRQAAERAKTTGTEIFIGGEMGIGNTTSAAALACALLDASPEQLAGPGTGLDTRGVSHKIQVIQRALAQHHSALQQPLEALRRLGGFEIAALAGSYLACAYMGLPILVDGFISSVAALAATKICAGAGHWMLFSHASAEPGHQCILEALEAEPLLDLGMRLGEGSGAATAVPLLRLACALHNDMATFAEAGVSEKNPAD